MTQDADIGFIGGGHMAQAMIRGLLRAGHPAARLYVAEPDAGSRTALQALEPRLITSAGNASVAGRTRVLVLAVKPQVMPVIGAELGQGLRPARQLILSVAAGITLDSLMGWFGADSALVRAMPNQPALIGAGISALAAGPALSAEDRSLAGYVVAALGRTVWLPDEVLMDAVTAVSGSGPAYFYMLIELMEQAGVELGLPGELAAVLARETALGAARVVLESGREPGELRAAVTSPAGTTAAALDVFTRGGFPRLVREALTAARDRSVALGRRDQQR